MINNSQIKRVFAFLNKNGVNTKSLVLTDRSAMVVKDNTRCCHFISVSVQNTETWNDISNKLLNVVEDLSEDGDIIKTIEIIKGVSVQFKNEVVPSYDKLGDLNVISDFDNIKLLEKTDSKMAEVLDAAINNKDSVEGDIDAIRSFYRGVEDLTQLRIMNGQRVLACFKNKLGVSPGEDEEKIGKALKVIENQYLLLTDGVVDITANGFKKSLKANSDKKLLIDKYSEAVMVSTYLSLRKEEDNAIKKLGKLIQPIPLWNEFLTYVLGCGVKMGAAIISELNIEAAPYPSSYWKYLGLDVTIDPNNGEHIGRRNWTRLMEKTEFLGTDGNITVTNNLGYNARLKSKLLYVMGGCILKAGGYYRVECYDPYKQRLMNREDLKDVYDERGKLLKSNKGRIHNMALRYMVKQFICDLHIYSKALYENKTVEPYAVAKLARKHGRKTFLDCLAETKLKGGKPEDYIGKVSKAA